MTTDTEQVPAEVLAFAQAIHDLDADTVADLLAKSPHLANERPYLPGSYYGGEGVRSFLFRAGPAYDRDETEAHLRIAQLLVDHGAEIEVGRPDSNETPLLNNAWLGNLRMVELLLANEADPNFPALRNETIVSCAARHDHKDNNGEIVAALINAGGRWHLGDLVSAGLQDRLVAELDRDPSLVRRDVPLYKKDVTGPPIHAGLHTDFFHHEDDREVRMMAVLLDRGADIQARDSEGFTPLDRTAELAKSRHDTIVAKAKAVREFLLSRGADPE